ncbi:MAG: hypothetical protein ACRDTP_10235 [Mycobacteriales bacterium]
MSARAKSGSSMSARAKTGSFDRVRARVPQAPARASVTPVDAEGKRALFSSAPPRPPLGSVVVECGGCGQTSVLAPGREALRALLPSLHLPLPARNRSYLRCPACGRWEWSHVSLRL